MNKTLNNRNRNSLRNLIPESELINRGVIFDQFKHLMIIHSGLYESESDLFLKVARLFTNNTNLTPDKLIFRKMRRATATDKDFYNFYKEVFPPKAIDIIISEIDAEDRDSNYIGSWHFLRQIIKGMKLSVKSPEFQAYLDFIMFICDIDEKCIRAANTKNENGEALVYEILKHWLCISKSNFDEPKDKKMAHYLIARVLFWAALVEHYIIIEESELEGDTLNRDGNTIFSNFIPKYNQQGDVLHSIEILLDKVNEDWAKRTYSKEKISWTQFSRDVANASTDNDQDPPDPESIRKYILRCRRGEQLITNKSYTKNVAILYGTEDEFQKLYSDKLVLIFIQLFDSVQRDLIIKGITQEFIVQQFERYPDYFELVANRFKEFKENKL